MIEIIKVTHHSEIEIARSLFLEYANSLSFNLCFQNFDHEINNLHHEYQKPDGVIFFIYYNNLPAGCVALRRFDSESWEMKRLHVKPDFRGFKLGKFLVEKLIEEARHRKYRFMKLDTINSMFEAIGLYESLGFKRVDPYRFNPIDGAIYFELEL